MSDTEQRSEKRWGRGGSHPNSLAASADPAIQRKIAEGRRKASRDLHAMDAWAANDFESGSGADPDADSIEFADDE